MGSIEDYPKRYEIVVRGSLSRRLGAAFEGLEVDRRPAATALTGLFTDQAHLHGVLNGVRDFGMELVSVHALE